jgi:molybdate transport system permease protein
VNGWASAAKAGTSARPWPRPTWPPALLVGASLVLATFLALPLGVLLVRAVQPAAVASLALPAAVEALRLTVGTTLIAVVVIVVFGTPLAYLLARYERFRGKWLLEAIVDLPMVLPPVVAGVALLLVFGRRGLLGEPLAEVGVTVVFSTAAVVLAQVFIASPFYVRAMKVGFAAVPVELEGAALTDGATRFQAFRYITLPIALPAFVEGVVLSWARALGEFGATIVFAGSLAGRTRTMPLAIFGALERDLDAAIALSAVLTALAAAVFLIVRTVSRGRT